MPALVATMSAPASARATAIAMPMPRLAPVTRAVLPLRLNLSRIVTESVRTSYQNLHAIAAAFHAVHSFFQTAQRQHVRNQFGERQPGRRRQFDRQFEILRLIHAGAGKLQFAPEEA